MMKAEDIREEFLSFFEKKHQSTRVKSSSLVPDNPTILLTTAGMVQFVPYFLGLEKPPYNPARATTCQKCARAGGKDSDIENVGRTPRHHTFFEMLGNFSFGDYFKEDVIPWAWDFVTNYLKLDKERLWVTIYEEDDEAGEIWVKAGVSPDRIIKKGKKDNFWGPPGPTGPCGPCSEIHYDLGEHLKCSEDCGVDTCECDRWVEIWNLVFMQLFQDEEGNLTPLEKKNVDTGMGLERIAMVCQGVNSTFETDLVRPILDKICEMSGKKYLENEKTDISLRIIADHARCVTFMISDKITPSNEGRGYVLRMILRRALRHGFIIGLEIPFMEKIVDVVIDNYKKAYPELVELRDEIQKVILEEENRFKLTINNGFKHIDNIIANLKGNIIQGEDAFKLYDTFGFPFELTKEIAQEKGIEVDETGFKNFMQEQKERARASVQKVVLTNDLAYVDKQETDFEGYTKDSSQATVIALVKDLEEVNETKEEDVVDVILDKTTFYGECGGQVGDNGVLIKQDGTKLEVIKAFRVGKVFVHRVIGAIKKGDVVETKIDSQSRREIEKHHSLAHLLQSSLQKVLGSNVHQAGSQVEYNRTRYDFNYNQALTAEQIRKIETNINEWIKAGIEQKTEIMTLDEAKNSGAMALFGEKYDDTVRVVCFGDVSKELCGGTHTKNTSELRLCKIISESAIASGVRRIEAVCSDSAIEYLNAKSDEIDKISRKHKVPYTEIDSKIEKLLQDNKDLNNKIAKMEEEQAKKEFATFISRAKDITIGDVMAKSLFQKLKICHLLRLKQESNYYLKNLAKALLYCAHSNKTVLLLFQK